MLKQFLQFKLSQKLSPQQIQLMKLIQLPTQEFEQRLKQELEENPALDSGKEEIVDEFDDFDNAEKYLKSALNHSSQRASSLITLAGLHYAKSDLHKAESVLEKYESTGRVTPRALMLSYLIQQRMGHIEKAEKTAGIILQTYPGSSEAKIISSGQNKRSEFEILREKYRQAQLEELQISSDNLAVSKEKSTANKGSSRSKHGSVC